MAKLQKIILIVFIACFGVLLLVHNIGILNEEKHQAEIARENRKITAFPRFGWGDKRLYSQFEDWYKDRIKGRERAIRLWRRINFNMGIILDEDLFLGKNNWLFSKSNRIIELKDGKQKMQEVAALQSYCEKQNTKFVLLVAPTKESVYLDEFPESERKNIKSYEYWNSALQKLADDAGINYLNVFDKLMDSKKQRLHDVYFPDDHHWSYYGAEIATDSFLQLSQNLLGRTFYQRQAMDKIYPKAFKEASYAHRLGISYDSKIDAPYSSKFTDEIYLVDCYTGQEQKVEKIVANDLLWGPINYGEAIIKNKQNPNGIKILILGDSYSSYMSPYLIQYASTIVSTHYRECVDKKKEVNLAKLIARYQPDIVLLEILGNSFYQRDSIAQIKLD